MIETNRLRIYAASQDTMEAFIEAQTAEVLKAAYTEMLNGCLNHPDQWDWYAIWMIELKDGTHIGELCFKGLSADGIAEIGYGISEEYQNNGYATEAVRAVLEWAFSHPEVSAVEAETDSDNTASKRVLEKCGFVLNGFIGEEGPRWAVSHRSSEISAFHISSSISIILDYDDDEINPELSGIMDALGINIDAEKLQDFYFDQKSGEGDLWVIGNHRNNCMVFNLYADPHDQMDIISFGVICTKEKHERIYDLMTAIKEKTQNKICFHSYDITEKSSRLSAVLAGESQYSFGSFTQKIRYAESFADFCRQNNI